MGLRSKKWAGLACLPMIAVAGCDPGNEQVAENEDEVISFLTPPTGNPLELDVYRGPAGINMLSGHQAKVPVSTFFTGTQTIGQAGLVHTFRAKTQDCSGDTGMLVRVSDATTGAFLRTLYNDDVPAGEGGTSGTSPDKGSQVIDTAAGRLRYEVRVFSQKRSTARCDLYWQMDSGPLKLWRTDNFGGALVEVGPLASNEFIEVQTPLNGTAGVAVDDTQLVLFTLLGTRLSVAGEISTGNADVLFNDNLSATDKDPRVNVSASSTPSNWSQGRTFALVGKLDRGTSSPRSVETVAEIVRGPLNRQLTHLDMVWSGGPSSTVTLAPGRYAMWVNAATTNPVGSLRVIGNPTDTAAFAANHCASGEPEGHPRGYERGQLNGDAFSMWVERASSTQPGAWAQVMLATGGFSRQVPLGAFGLDIEAQRFVVQFEVRTSGVYRLNTSVAATPNSGVVFTPNAFVLRNPDSTELKVAELNMLYASGASFGAAANDEYMNASNLLATRGSIITSTGQVEERKDQAPYQIQSDVVFMTEGEDTARLWDLFQAEAERRGPLSWGFTYGGNEWSAGDEFLHDGWFGFGGLFASENLWPTAGDSASLRFQSYDGVNYCDHDGRFIRCGVWDNGDHGRHKAIIPARLNVRRSDPDPDRPIVAFGVHLHTGEAGGQVHRRYEVDSMAGRLEEFIAANPRAFNKDGNTDPKGPGNRIILVGDFNAYTHSCGEHYWLLRILRERFGYAVDVAMAAEGSVANGYAMHNVGTSVVDAVTQLPRGFLARTGWQAITDPVRKWAQAWETGFSGFPWWARSFRDTTTADDYPGDRPDMIILVGRGWAADDPVQSYWVMQDTLHRSPFSVTDEDGNVLGGVEMFQVDSGPGGVPDSGNSYNPNHDVHFGTGPGKLALQTDHRPIAARLRVFTGGQADDR